MSKTYVGYLKCGCAVAASCDPKDVAEFEGYGYTVREVEGVVGISGCQCARALSRIGLSSVEEAVAEVERLRGTQTERVIMPPEGTTTGCRCADGKMWIACKPEPEGKPGIAVCEYAGNWINPPCYKVVAIFESEADRDFVLALHHRYLEPSKASPR